MARRYQTPSMLLWINAELRRFSSDKSPHALPRFRPPLPPSSTPSSLSFLPSYLSAPLASSLFLLCLSLSSLLPPHSSSPPLGTDKAATGQREGQIGLARGADKTGTGHPTTHNTALLLLLLLSTRAPTMAGCAILAGAVPCLAR
eukprot:3882664-Rhodomonas_salina.1